MKNPANVWMTFSAPLILGTDLEGDFRNPLQINFCDFASAVIPGVKILATGYGFRRLLTL